MLTRCYRKSAVNYERYGGRGITVCDSWKNSFVSFYKDMGDPPNGYQLERIDNSKGYCPENCKWATPKEQSLNRRSNVWMTLNGITKTMKEWCNELGLNYSMVRYRKMEAKLPDEECLTQTGMTRVKLEYNGKVYTPKEIAERLNMNIGAVYLRIYKGWPVEEIINRPHAQPYRKPGWKWEPITSQ